jgi:hypothetical protein
VAPAAVVLLLALAGCNNADAGPATPAAPATAAASSAPAARQFTSFAVPCPTVGDRPGSPVDKPLDTPISLTADCSYGSTTKFPHVNSVSTIHKAGNPQGAPDEIAGETFEKLRLKASTNSLEGVFSEERPELGDAAFLMVSHRDNVALLVVRSANVVIQASATIDAVAGKDAALTQLRALEPQVTAVARAVLAELR